MMSHITEEMLYTYMHIDIDNTDVGDIDVDTDI